MAAELWGHEWRDKVVNIKCDSESAIAVCSTSKTKKHFLNMCLYNLWLITARYNIKLLVSHIRGVNNVLPDALSRGRFNDLGEVHWEVLSNEMLCLSL